VLARGTEHLGEAHRGESGPGDHAEYGIFSRLADTDLTGSTLYTTLEPCSRRNHPNVPCAQWAIDRGVATVFIGIYDPNPSIYREGWRMLRDAGVALRDFPSDLRAEIRADNAAFLDQYQRAVGDRGSATFDYTLNGGRYEIIGADDATFSTRWTRCGARSVYALDYDNHVALARYANRFDEIDDPGALDFGHYTVDVKEGEIVVFRNAGGLALVQIVGVLSGPSAGDDRTELRFDYELRR
jgi:diaminohydroxyphosphoribosylaminopyrimidine deaminase/5-amino-6-(5-phosphoribosylamino)uracil reductase